MQVRCRKMRYLSPALATYEFETSLGYKSLCLIKEKGSCQGDAHGPSSSTDKNMAHLLCRACSAAIVCCHSTVICRDQCCSTTERANHVNSLVSISSRTEENKVYPDLRNALDFLVVQRFLRLYLIFNYVHAHASACGLLSCECLCPWRPEEVTFPWSWSHNKAAWLGCWEQIREFHEGTECS